MNIINKCKNLKIFNKDIMSTTTILKGVYKNKDILVIMKPSHITNIDTIKNTSITNEQIIFSNERFNKYYKSYNIDHEIILIYPALKEDIGKYGPKQKIRVFETFDDYKKNVYPFAKTQNLVWIKNILEKKVEQHKIIYEDDDFILLPDLKWDGKNLDELYCLAIVKDENIKCIRDLNQNHLGLLDNIYNNGSKAITKTFGIKEEELRKILKNGLPSTKKSGTLRVKLR